MDFKENPDLVANSKNKQLLKSIAMARKILKEETTFQEEFERHGRELREKNKLLEKDKNGQKDEEKKSEEINDDGKRKRFKDGSKENSENGSKVDIVIEKHELDEVEEVNKVKEDETDVKSPVALKKIKLEKEVNEEPPKEIKPEKVYEIERFQSYMENNVLETFYDSQSVTSESNESEKMESVSISPQYQKHAKRLNIVTADLVSQARLGGQHLPHFTIIREIISEIKGNKIDMMSLFQTGILKDLSYIQNILEKSDKKEDGDRNMLDEVKNSVEFFQQEILKEAFDISILKSKYDCYLNQE